MPTRNTARETITGVSGKVGLTFSDGSGRTTSTGKKDAAELRGSMARTLLRGSMARTLLGSSHMSTFRFLGPHSFPLNALTLTVDTA